MTKKHFGITVVFSLVIGAFIAILARGLRSKPEQAASAQEGNLARDFSVRLLQAGQGDVTLTNLRGKQGVLLNFWASWCQSCREEAVIMQTAYQKWKGQVYFLGVAIQDQAPEALRFAAQYGKTYPLALDVTGQLSIDYGVTGVPETFFIDKNGIILHREAAPVSPALLQEWLKKIQ